jgi:hypothetical protein
MRGHDRLARGYPRSGPPSVALTAAEVTRACRGSGTRATRSAAAGIS